ECLQRLVRFAALVERFGARSAVPEPHQQADACTHRSAQPGRRSGRVAEGTRGAVVSASRARLTRASARESMKTSIAAKLDQARQRLLDINALLSSENATRDLDQFRKLSREHAELE